MYTDSLDPLPTVVTSATGAPTVPVAAPSAAPTPADISESPAGMPLAPGDETGDADLDRFFAALRQVVHDARERLPLESDRPDPPELIADASRAYAAGLTATADAATSTGTMVPTRLDPVTTTLASTRSSHPRRPN